MKRLSSARKDYLHVMSMLWDFFTSKTGAFIIGVGAIVIGMYQFYISKPILEYESAHTNIISAADVSDLKVTVKEREYKDMYLTTLTLLNTGSQALDGGDVSKIGHDPIRIIVPEDARLVTSPAVSAKLVPYDGDIVIDFDFLNPDNQIAINLLHEKESDKFEIVGSAVNVNSISRAWSPVQKREMIIGILLVCFALYIFANILSRRS